MVNSNSSRAGAAFAGNPAEILMRHLPWQWILFDGEFRAVQMNAGSDSSSSVSPVGSLEDFFLFVELDMTPFDWRRSLKKMLETGETTRFDRVNSLKKIKEPQVYNLICSPARADDGKVVGGILIVEDITDRIVLEKRLAFYERLAVVGKLAARIAHELNNPLDGILRFVNLSLRVKKEGDPSQRYLEQARKGLLRMVRIIRELLEFSRSTITAFEHTSINGMAEEAIRSMESRALAKGVEIVKELGGDIPEVRSGDLFQVFCNLIKNAIDAMPDGGTLTVRTEVADGMIRATLTDTGVGLDAEMIDRIFEPFFTTKDSTEGTGLGLAISKDIVEKYEGTLTVESEPGKGSTFIMAIPVENRP